MKNFIVLAVALAGILIVVSLLLDKLMGIFIVSIMVCILVDAMEREKKHKNPKDDGKA